MSNNLSWGRILEVIEKEKTPLTRARLATCTGIDQANIDIVKVSQLLWSFLGNHCFQNSVYERRLQLTNGEDHNGLERWRAPYQECEGGAEQVVMGGIRRCLRFPKMPAQKQTPIVDWRVAEPQEDARRAPPRSLPLLDAHGHPPRGRCHGGEG